MTEGDDQATIERERKKKQRKIYKSGERQRMVSMDISFMFDVNNFDVPHEKSANKGGSGLM